MSTKASDVVLTDSRLVFVHNHALHPKTFFITPDPSVPSATIRVACSAAQKQKGKQGTIPGIAEMVDAKTKTRTPMPIEFRHIAEVRKHNAIVDRWFDTGELVCRAAGA